MFTSFHVQHVFRSLRKNWCTLWPTNVEFCFVVIKSASQVESTDVRTICSGCVFLAARSEIFYVVPETDLTGFLALHELSVVCVNLKNICSRTKEHWCWFLCIFHPIIDVKLFFCSVLLPCVLVWNALARISHELCCYSCNACGYESKLKKKEDCDQCPQKLHCALVGFSLQPIKIYWSSCKDTPVHRSNRSLPPTHNSRWAMSLFVPIKLLKWKSKLRTKRNFIHWLKMKWLCGQLREVELQCVAWFSRAWRERRNPDKGFSVTIFCHFLLFV